MTSRLIEDPGNFYQTCSGILVAILLAGVVELRALLAPGRELSLVQKMSATIVLGALAVGGFCLVNVPSAVLGHQNWFTDRDRLVTVIALTGGVVIVTPLIVLLQRVWSRTDEVLTDGGHAAPASPYAPSPAWMLVLVVLVALLDSRRRTRSR